MEAFSSDTGKTYPTWEALIEAEANGFVVVAIIHKGDRTWPWVLGPYPNADDAKRSRERLRNRLRREQRDYPDYTFRLHVRPAWKDPR